MRQALELALEFIERVNKDGWILADFEPEMHNTIAAIKEALSQPEQSNTCGEPDWKGLVLSHNEDCESRCDMDRCGYKPYYEYSKRRCPDCPVHEKIWVDDTIPPQRKPLTDEEIQELWESTASYYNVCDFARAIEAAHGIKE